MKINTQLTYVSNIDNTIPHKNPKVSIRLYKFQQSIQTINKINMSYIIWAIIPSIKKKKKSKNHIEYGIMVEKEVEGRQSEEIPSFHIEESITIVVHQPLDPQTGESSHPIYQTSRLTSMNLVNEIIEGGETCTRISI